jgi:hypothetical protein
MTQQSEMPAMTEDELREHDAFATDLYGKTLFQLDHIESMGLCTAMEAINKFDVAQAEFRCAVMKAVSGWMTLWVERERAKGRPEEELIWDNCVKETGRTGLKLARAYRHCHELRVNE